MRFPSEAEGYKKIFSTVELIIMTEEQRIEASIGRMIASLTRSTEICERITHGVRVLEEALQMGSEHFLHAHKGVCLPDSQVVLKQTQG